MTANCLKKGKYIYSCFLSSSPIYLGKKTSSDNLVVFLLADLVSLSKQRFEQLGMKNHDVKAFFDKVQKMYTMKDNGQSVNGRDWRSVYTRYKIIAHPGVAEMVASQYDNGKTRFNKFLKGLDTDEY